MNIEQRIAQFEKMAHEDPDNEMAHFSLGNAYGEAGRHADAAASFLKCLQQAPGMSKAYQLAAEHTFAAGDEDAALVLAEKGFVQAASRGDVKPRDALKAMLEKHGRAVPEIKVKKTESEDAGGDFMCTRTGRAGTQLPKPPFRGPIGNWIHQNISRQTWEAWIGQGTKVINELRLDLSRDEDGATYDEQMREYLGIDAELYEELMGKQPH